MIQLWKRSSAQSFGSDPVPGTSISHVSGGSSSSSGPTSSIQENSPSRDPLIYPGVYAPSGFDMMGILVSGAACHCYGFPSLLQSRRNSWDTCF